MFALHIRNARLTLAAAALAIVATSFAPAVSTFAAPLAPSQEHAMALKPDISVKITRQDPYNDGVLHWFTIKNVGTAPSGVIAVKAMCASSSYGDTDYTVAIAKVIPGLKKGEEKQMSFACETNYGAQVTVGTQNDSNTSNNVDTYNFF